MKYSTRLSDSVHILAYIYLNPDGDLSSSAIARSINTNPSYVRQLIMPMKKRGLITSARGTAAPQLAKNPSKITLFDIYRAAEGKKPLIHCDDNVNPDCSVGVNIQLSLRDCFDKVQKKAEKALKNITLLDVVDKYNLRVADNPTKKV